MAEQLDLSGFSLDEITELASHGFGLEALAQRLSAAAVAEIERRQAHTVDGAHSLADWGASVSGYEHHHAAEFARKSGEKPRKLGILPRPSGTDCA